nr:hypothetical protein [Hahella ganghwensis]
MKSWMNRSSLHESIVNKMVAASQTPDKKPVLTDSIAQWLAQLTLLYGVPTSYLTPDVRMLPNESMRFFFLDRNWLDRLVDGALSVGVLSTQTSLFNEVFFEDIYQQIDLAQQKLRAQLKNQEPNSSGNVGGPITGLLFRSQVVSGWPGLEVYASAQGAALPMLRMDRLAPSVLLCLFDGVPDDVDFVEPSEALHFGITREKGASDFKVSLRGLGLPTVEEYPPGKQIPDPQTPGAFLTAPGNLRANNSQPGVVDIQGLVSSIETSMPQGALDKGKIEPGGFAVQLVQGAGKQSYKISNGTPYPKCAYSGN